MQDNALQTAPFFPRAAAYLFDRLILGTVLFVPKLTVALNSMGSDALSRAVLFSFSAADIVLWALGCAYFVIFTALLGATPGKKAMGLTVVDKSGEKPALVTVLGRETFARYLSSLMGIGYLLCLFDSENGALHDRIMDTRVIYAEKKPVKASASVPAPVRVQKLGSTDDWYAPNR